MAEQNPAINAVTYIISTLKANSVNAQDIESGIEIPIKVFLLPCLIIRLEHKLPNKAPKSRKKVTKIHHNFKRSQYAGAYSFGFFIDVFGCSLLLSPLLQG